MEMIKSQNFDVLNINETLSAFELQCKGKSYYYYILWIVTIYLFDCIIDACQRLHKIQIQLPNDYPIGLDLCFHFCILNLELYFRESGMFLWIAKRI